MTFTTQDRTPVLSIRNLSKRLGGRQILTDISLDIYPGEIFGFLGPNGSGKTTTIKLMLGLLRLEAGSISICGHDVVKDFEGAIANVGGIIENPEMYKYLTGRENLEQYSRMYGTVDGARIDEVVRLVRLEARIGDPISKYSLGMRQRLGVAQALLNHPRLLVLDEPTNGLDPAGIKELRDILQDLSHTENVAVFISSHQLAELDQMCDRVGIIDRGVLQSIMTIDEVRHAGNGAGLESITVTVDPATLSLVPGNCPLAASTADTLQGTLPREDIPDVVTSLAAAGVRIYELTTVKHSIEDVFLALTADYTPAGGGGTEGYAPKPAAEGVYVPDAAKGGNA